MKIGSLFSGYGGLDLAVEEVLGGEVAWFCEWDDAPGKILQKRFPGIPNFRDVSKVDWASVPPVDVLTGGFPCQDVSLAGGRAGLAAGTRSGLWSEFAKAISVLQPKLVIIENVRGLLSAKADSDMEWCSWCMGETGGGATFFASTRSCSRRAGRARVRCGMGRLTRFRCRSSPPAFQGFHSRVSKRVIFCAQFRLSKAKAVQCPKRNRESKEGCFRCGTRWRSSRP